MSRDTLVNPSLPLLLFGGTVSNLLIPPPLSVTYYLNTFPMACSLEVYLFIKHFIEKKWSTLVQLNVFSTFTLSSALISYWNFIIFSDYNIWVKWEHIRFQKNLKTEKRQSLKKKFANQTFFYDCNCQIVEKLQSIK